MASIRHLREWLGRWGFAAAVACALGVAALAGAVVPTPTPAPGFALQATIVYRAEVAATIFATGYLGLLSFVLALHNRGFTEIGTTGIAARDLVRTEAEEATMLRECRRPGFRRNIVDKESQRD